MAQLTAKERETLAKDIKKKGQTKYQFRILSPDGIDLDETIHSDFKLLLPFAKKWRERFKKQGYYSTINRGQRVQIPFKWILNELTIVILKDNEEVERFESYYLLPPSQQEPYL